MEADYLLAAIPEPVTILGHRLLPFSLGHAKLLRRFENAFAAGKVPELGDLLIAIFICSRTYHEAVDGLADPGLKKYLEKWGRKVGKFDFLEKCQAFAKYIKDGSRWPDLHDPEEGGRIPGAPFIQRVQIVLQGKLGFSPQEALNHPWGAAIHDYFAFWELEGQIKIFSPEDEEHLQHVKRIRAEILAEMEAAKRG